MRDYIRILTKIRETPWLITEEGLQVILAIVDERLNNGRLSDEEIQARLSSLELDQKPDMNNRHTHGGTSTVGVLSLMGPIFGKANLMTEMSGATSLEAFSNDLSAMLNDGSVDNILLHIDSPGGTSEMVKEVADQIYEGKDTKPIYALADSMAGSAAYYLASQAQELYTTHSGMVGSIGVYTVHEDQSGADAQAGHKFTFVSAGKYKTEGNEHQPLTEEARAYRQEIVDDIYEGFVTDVARGRATTTENVVESYGQGRTLTSKKALEAGMVDGITTFDSLLGHIASKPKQVQVAFSNMPAHTHAFPVSAANTGTDSVAAMTKTVSGTLIGNTVHLSTTAPIANLESKEWEHSEPGTGSPPQPRKDEDGSDDIAIRQRWRRDDLPVYGPNAPSPNPPPPNTNLRGEGMINNEQLEALDAIRISLGATEENFFSELRVAVDGYRELQTSLAAATEEDRLKSDFPQMWREHQDLLSERRENRAKAFTDSVKSFTVMEGEQLRPSNFGMSALAMEHVTQMHLKFADGTASLEDFENCVKGITQGGFVEYGERGSARTRDHDIGSYDTGSAEGVKNIRNTFAAKVTEIQKQDNLDFSAALTEAAKRYPELAMAYQHAVPVTTTGA